jgi:hypothetical protein
MAIATYWILNRVILSMFSEENLEKILFSLFEKLITSEDGQKQLYSLGALIGNGIKTGMGISKPSGKRGFNDIIAEIASAFIQGKFKQSETPETSPIGTPSPQRPM